MKVHRKVFEMKQFIVICIVILTLCSPNANVDSIFLKFGTPSQNSPVDQILRLGSDVISLQNSNILFNENPGILLHKYDFIIVGAGPAGCVLANRLTENPNWNVLLLEAGRGENVFHEMPLMAGFLQGTDSNWNYRSVPQKQACFGMYNNQCALPRGKSMGGTSSINYMIYNRGNRRDYDRWAASGNTGWSYKDVLPYFKKSENAHLKGLENSPYHGHSGPLSVEDVPYRSNTVHRYIKAAEEAGIKRTDYNGESQLGVSYVQATTRKGHRHSAARAYINPIINRRNLHILANTRVTKVLIDPVTKTATGVEFLNNRRFHKATATKEVILSSGTFNSPQLLMLSGVGPEKHLREKGLPVIQNLPVGERHYDHLSHFGPTFIVNTTGNTIRVSEFTVLDIQDFLRGRGKITSIGGVEALTFIKTPNSKEPADIPDAELIFVPGSFSADEGTGLKEGANLRDDIYNKVYKPLEHNREDSFTILVMHFHPKSHGPIRLRDRNPLHWPIIQPNYFSVEDDAETLLHGIKEAIRISKSPALQKIGVRLHDIPLPGCEHLTFASDNYWRCSIRSLSYTLHHQVASCRMGPASDPTTVVSPELKVHGLKRLRVVDTSIIPFPPTAHTNAASFMIGEKAADMIKRDWNNVRK